MDITENSPQAESSCILQQDPIGGFVIYFP